MLENGMISYKLEKMFSTLKNSVISSVISKEKDKELHVYFPWVCVAVSKEDTY